MKQLLLIIGTLVLLLVPAVALTKQAAAVEIFPNCGSGSANGSPHVCQETNNQAGNNGTNNPIINIIRAAIEVISIVVGAAAIIGVLISSIRFITASGDSNALASARSGLAYSLIGVIVVVLAQTIVIFVLDKIK